MNKTPLPSFLSVDDVECPRFKWRGMHLDVARHFFPMSDLKRFVQLMALYKFNTLHLHLTDDQGWRLQSLRFPRLTEIGAWRYEKDGSHYGGFYSREEIKELVQFCEQKQIQIVPEIDLPGHAAALIAAYPELSCTEDRIDVVNEWGIFPHVLCIGREETFQFVRELWEETAELFPGKYLHMGGDECLTQTWQTCPRCRQKMECEGLVDDRHWQSYFTKRVAEIIIAMGRIPIGWDEVLNEDLPPEVVVMSWRGMESGRRAASEGHHVIMCPTSHCYFDYYQAKGNEPKAIGGYLTVEEVLSFDPIPPELPPDFFCRILGAQGNLWTEYMRTMSQVEYMALPRMAALAEALWTPPQKRDLITFLTRWRAHEKELKEMGYNFRSQDNPNSPLK